MGEVGRVARVWERCLIGSEIEGWKEVRGCDGEEVSGVRNAWRFSPSKCVEHPCQWRREKIGSAGGRG